MGREARDRQKGSLHLTPAEVHDLSDGLTTAAGFFRVEAVDLCDAYAALVREVQRFLAGETFTAEQRRELIEALDRQADSIVRSRQKMVDSAQALTTTAAILDQSRAAGEVAP